MNTQEKRTFGGGRPVSGLEEHSTIQPAAHHRTRARARISAACVRCQKRKIRCDGVLPACSGCQKAGAPCVDGGTSREIPRNYLTDLEARAAWLESIVRERCPDIDLSQGPGRASKTAQSAEASRPLERSDSLEKDGSPHDITEQIGLISVSAGSDLRFLGPSSGLFFTKFVLAGLSRAAGLESSTFRVSSSDNIDDILAPADLVDMEAKDFPADERHTTFLSRVYFDSVHLQFPFLHEPSFTQIVHRIYNEQEIDPVEQFTVFMVLAVGATIYSRKSRRNMSGDGYYASALQRLDEVFRVPSLSSSQCLLLLEMYTIHEPSSGLSLWTLHYHSLGSALELGLQRDIPSSRHINPLQVELRRRVFWCVYTINRQLSITMGRPIGFIDEQCEMRLPLDVNDDELTPEAAPSSNPIPGRVTTMSSAIHLFKASRFSSEIKSVLFCTERSYPPYFSPVLRDRMAWRADMLDRLRSWRKEIPRHPDGDRAQSMDVLCEIKYHEFVMLVLRPNPLIQQPTKEDIVDCFASAIDCSKLYAKLYRDNQLRYGWMNVHSLFLCVMTMFWCVWTPGGVADEVDFDCLTSALKASSDILSATGEYWPEAKRSRDVLDRIFTATIRRFSSRQNTEGGRRSALSCTNATQSPSLTTGPSNGSSLTGETAFFQGDNTSVEFTGVPSQGMLPGAVPESMAVDFAPYPSTSLDSFMTTDWLSFFMSADEIGNIGVDNNFANYDFGI